MLWRKQRVRVATALFILTPGKKVGKYKSQRIFLYSRSPDNWKKLLLFFFPITVVLRIREGRETGEIFKIFKFFF